MSSPYLLTKQITVSLTSLLSALDDSALEREARVAVASLKRLAVDVRLNVRDYELSESRQEQQVNRGIAVRDLETLREGVLAASEYNIFSAVDVAQLTAHLDSVIESLE